MKGREKQLARILIDQLEEATEAQTKKIISEFISLVDKNRLIKSWRVLQTAIHGAWKDKYGASMITVVTAHDLLSSSRKALEKLAPGADLIEKVDPRLIAGAIVRIDDKKIDGSVAGNLRRLKQALE
jgi:F0F1-type ATP synthase delta subunit